MPVRSSMVALITRVRQMIYDPSGQVFTDQDVQDYLDVYRDDIRYEGEEIAPTIINLPSTNNQASTIFADYYSKWQWWEDDLVLQAYSGGKAWVVVTSQTTLLEPIVGHWQFQANVFTSGTVPGQLPPVFCTGKVHDPYAAAADLLELWAAMLAGAYDITVDGQTLRRSQLMQAKLTLAQQYRKRAKTRTVKMVRRDIRPEVGSRQYRLLDTDDSVRGR